MIFPLLSGSILTVGAFLPLVEVQDLYPETIITPLADGNHHQEVGEMQSFWVLSGLTNGRSPILIKREIKL